MPDFVIKNYDLVLDESSKDLAVEQDDSVAFLPQVIEAMEMRVGDDIDYPAYYSKQRQFQNSEGEDSELERVADAYRVMRYFDDVDQNSVDIEMANGRLMLAFKLSSASRGIKVFI